MQNWFKRYGYFFIPTNLPGLIILLLAFVYLVFSFIIIDRNSHSVSDTLINFAFRFLITGIVYSLFAFLTRRKDTEI